VNWCSIARKEGFLGLESIAESEPDSFSRKGLHLLIDGSDSKVIRNVLEVELQTIEQRDILSAKVFESMGGYSPTIGIIGAVLGLIHVLGNLNDPNKLGPGIAVAFVATIYGVSLANLIFLPISQKIQKIIFSQSRLKEMVIEGLLSIAEGENPRVLELKMQGFFVARK
jgi:chemotaxis protein MotA